MTEMKAGRMMAREYARVLSSLSAEEREAVKAYFRSLHDPADGPENLKNFLDHPAISAAEKLGSLESMEPRRFSPLVGRVIADIIKRRMTFLFSEIAEEMQRLSDEADNVHQVAVTSAAPLNEPQRQTLAAMMQLYSGGSVTMRFKVDGSLLAGFSIQTGDTVLDNSVRTDLENIRRRLMAVSLT
jgi:F-type H+-transporting ATPase subunit delta